MPRPNPARAVIAERHLAERIAYERGKRDWSLERLAIKVTQAGCPLQGSAIYKIESGNPPRRITVDELVAFASVFEMPVEQLLQPVAIAQSEEIQVVAKALGEVAGDMIDQARKWSTYWTEIYSKRPHLVGLLEEVLANSLDEAVTRAAGREDQPATATAYKALEAIRKSAKRAATALGGKTAGAR